MPRPRTVFINVRDGEGVWSEPIAAIAAATTVRGRPPVTHSDVARALRTEALQARGRPGA